MDRGVRLAGVELYFDDLDRARSFYEEVLGLVLEEHVAGHHAKFETGSGFVCAEGRGLEDYASADKAVVFLEVDDLRETLSRVDPVSVVASGQGGGQAWTAVRDPEGHTIMLVEKGHGD